MLSFPLTLPTLNRSSEVWQKLLLLVLLCSSRGCRSTHGKAGIWFCFGKLLSFLVCLSLREDRAADGICCPNRDARPSTNSVKALASSDTGTDFCRTSGAITGSDCIALTLLAGLTCLRSGCLGAFSTSGLLLCTVNSEHVGAFSFGQETMLLFSGVLASDTT